MLFQRRVWAAALLTSSLASCSVLFSYDEFEAREDGGVSSNDGGSLTHDGAGCRTVSPHVDTCDERDVGGALELTMSSEYVLDTDKATLATQTGEFIPLVAEAIVQEDDTKVLHVFTSSFTLTEGTTLRARGTRALVIVANEAISVAGTIDVSSTLKACMESTVGAGSNPEICAEHPPATGTMGSSGAGAGFGSRGGAGQPGVAGGLEQETSTIRGGCNGGSSNSVAADNLGGIGGGAIALVSKTSITVSATGAILASGSGGGGGLPGMQGSSGGGGGSGGMVDLSAPSVTLAAGAHIVSSGGGGGGGGGAGSGSSVGLCGADGNVDSAAGGAGGSSDTGAPGGAGGNGSGITSAADDGTLSGAAGHGGGGGGGGRIVLHSPTPSIDSDAIVSPRSSGP